MAQVTVEKPVVVAAPQMTALPGRWERDAIKSDQDGIRGDLTSLFGRIHMNAYQCLAHCAEHGDTSLLVRLLTDVVGPDSGYRRAGIIAWLRKYSPCELKGKTINLSGLNPDGTKRAFDLVGAWTNHFTTLKEAAEGYRPVYRDVLVSRLEAAIKAFNDSVKNTLIVDGKPQPIDKSKPFYDGVNMDKMIDTFGKIETNVIELSTWQDKTKERREAEKTLREAQAELEAVNA